MTLTQLIKLLKTEGVNSKQKILALLQNDTELKELKDSIELKFEFEKNKYEEDKNAFIYNSR